MAFSDKALKNMKYGQNLGPIGLELGPLGALELSIFVPVIRVICMGKVHNYLVFVGSEWNVHDNMRDALSSRPSFQSLWPV